MTHEITILIADDHPIVRKGLREVIEEEKQFRVVAEAGDGRAALAALAQWQPQVTILDVDMPLLNGFAVAREITAQAWETAVVFLTMHRDEDLFNEALDLGARGFVLKDSALDDIIECIRAVTANNHYISHALTSMLVNRSRRSLELTVKQPSLNDLTQAERYVLQLIADDLSGKEIAERLSISPRTVEKHRENICRKLDLKGSHALFKFALQNKSKLR